MFYIFDAITTLYAPQTYSRSSCMKIMHRPSPYSNSLPAHSPPHLPPNLPTDLPNETSCICLRPSGKRLLPPITSLDLENTRLSAWHIHTPPPLACATRRKFYPQRCAQVVTYMRNPNFFIHVPPALSAYPPQAPPTLDLSTFRLVQL